MTLGTRRGASSKSARAASRKSDDDLIRTIRGLASEIQLLAAAVEGVKDDCTLQMKRTAQLQMEVDTLKKML